MPDATYLGEGRREGYVEVEAAGPYVDLTVMGPYRTAHFKPADARALAREVLAAAEEIENPPPPDDLLPGLSIVLSHQPISENQPEEEK